MITRSARNKKSRSATPQPDYIYRRIRLALTDRQVRVRLRRLRWSGEQRGKHISLSPHRELLPTLIHESLHFLYPQWCETKVIKVERELCARLSPRQFRNLLKDLAEIM